MVGSEGISMFLVVKYLKCKLSAENDCCQGVPFGIPMYHIHIPAWNTTTWEQGENLRRNVGWM